MVRGLIMAYNHLMNAKCLDGFKRYKWSHFGRCQSAQASLAIDELGRLFAWGRNLDGQCGMGNPAVNPERDFFEYATQVGSEEDWLKAGGGEYSSMALNLKGELWGAGVGNALYL